MFGNSSINERLHPSGTTTWQSQTIEDEKLKTVREAGRCGLLALYKERLRNCSHFCSSESWWEFIDNIGKARKKSKDDDDTDLLLCYLFVIAIDSQIAEDEKKAAIAKTLHSLDESELTCFIYCLAHSNPPPVICTHILRWCPQETWEKFSLRIVQQKQEMCHICRDIWTPWIMEVLNNCWMPEEKAAFLERIFSCLPIETGDELLYYLMLHAVSLQKQLAEIPSSSICERIEKIKQRVVQHCQSILNTPTEIIRINCSSFQREYFLEWFKNHALDHSNASLVALDFTEKDWEWLAGKQISKSSPWNKSYFPRISKETKELAMRWMTDIVLRLQQGTFPLHYGNSTLNLFFRNASLMIEMESWNKISYNHYRSFSKALNEEVLFYHFDNFNRGNLQDIIIKCIMLDEPGKFLNWIQIILVKPVTVPNKTALDKVSELFNLIAKNKCFSQAISSIFDMKQTDDVLKMLIFSALKEDDAKEVLKYILQDKTAGMETLVQWMDSFTSKHSNETLNPFVEVVFPQKIIPLLSEIDPSILSELESMLCQAPFVLISSRKDITNLFFSTDILLTDPATLQKRAIRKLKECFMNQRIAHEDCKNIVEYLQKDLGGWDEHAVWLPKLFEQLPEDTWPLLFLYLGHHILGTISTIPLSKRPKIDRSFQNEKMIVPSWISGLNEWLLLAVKTLGRMVDNPCLNNEEQRLVVSAMKQLYEALCRSKTTNAVVQKFIENAPRRLFIPVLNTLGHACFYLNDGKLHHIVSKALGEADVDKISFIADCLYEFYFQRIRDDENFYPGVDFPGDFEIQLWSEPYITTHEERSAIVKILIGKMRGQFLQYFVNAIWVDRDIIVSLAVADPPFAEKLFTDGMKLLCSAGYHDESKLSIFLNICNCYDLAGLDPLTLLKHRAVEELLPTIRGWYSFEENIDKSTTTKSALLLLRFFNPEGFYPALFRQITIKLSNRESIPTFELKRLFIDLEELGWKDEMLRQLFEEHQDIVQNLREYFESSIVTSNSPLRYRGLVPLVDRLVPDWQERLIAWTKGQIDAEREKYAQKGAPAGYHNILSNFKSLKKVGLLEGLIVALRADLNDIQARELQKIEESLRNFFLDCELQ